jgi:DNA-binding GntR family transcriptional regulator
MNENKTLLDDFGYLLRPKSLHEMVYENLKAAILNGKFVVGVSYNELELARELGVSRTPVREALLRLAAEKLIIFQPRRGITVNYFSKKDIEDLFELRQAIEELAATQVVENLSDDQIKKVKSIIKEQEECIKNNYEEKRFLEIDKRFHLFLIEASGNRFMVQTFNTIRDYITITAREALMAEGRPSEVVFEHKAIFKTLSEKNLERVKEAIKKHLANTKLSVMKYHIENKVQ